MACNRATFGFYGCTQRTTHELDVSCRDHFFHFLFQLLESTQIQKEATRNFRDKRIIRPTWLIPFTKKSLGLAFRQYCLEVFIIRHTKHAANDGFHGAPVAFTELLVANTTGYRCIESHLCSHHHGDSSHSIPCRRGLKCGRGDNMERNASRVDTHSCTKNGLVAMSWFHGLLHPTLHAGSSRCAISANKE